MRSRLLLLIFAHLAVVLTTAGAADFSEPAPDPPALEPMPGLDEVRGILLTNLTKTTSTELDRAAVKGILNELEGRIELVEAPKPKAPGKFVPLIAKTAVHDKNYGYIRVNRVEKGLAAAFDHAFSELEFDGKAEGLILDLRFARGVAYAEAARFVDRFLEKERKLLTIGAETIRSTAKTNAIKVPVAALINAKTSGAAEALAAMMRRANVGLLVGSDTAGGVSQFREFPLSTGQRLRVATGPLLFGEGETLIDDAVQPDIEVVTPLPDETAYLADAFRDPPGYADDIERELGPDPFRPLSEADLVRRHNQEFGFNEGSVEAPVAPAPAPEEKTEIRDPALSRALDVLKALAVVRQITPF